MTAKVHVRLMIVSQTLGVAVASLGNLVLGYVLFFDGSALAAVVIMTTALISAVAGYILPGLFFQYAVPVRCSQCAGKAYLRGRTPVSYKCLTCGHLQQTRVSQRGRTPTDYMMDSRRQD
jgi:hypothetical protein